MAENILKGTIKVDAPGLQQTVTDVKSSVEKISHEFKKMGAASYYARDAVMDLGHIARDLPYAANNFAVLAGPIGRVSTLLQVLKEETGSTAGAFKSVWASLAGGGGAVIGLELAVSAISLLGGKLSELFSGSSQGISALKLYGDTFKKASDAVGEDVVRLEAYKIKLNDTNLSVAERSKVLQAYNKTADETNRIDKSQIDNLQLINEKLDKQNSLIMQRALTTAALSKLTEQANGLINNELKLQEQFNVKGYKSLDDYLKKQKEADAALKKGFKVDPNASNNIHEIQKGLDGVINPAILAAKSYNAGELAFTNLVNTVKKGRNDLENTVRALSGLVTPEGLSKPDLKTPPKDKTKTNFFDEWLDFDPAKVKEGTEHFAKAYKVALDYSLKNEKWLDGLDKIVQAPNQKAGLEAARQWWKSYEEGYLRFKFQPLPDMKDVIKMVPKLPNDTKNIEDEANTYLDGLKSVFERHNTDVPMFNPLPSKQALIDEYTVFFQSIGSKIPKLIKVDGLKVPLTFEFNTGVIKKGLEDAKKSAEELLKNLNNNIEKTMQAGLTSAASSFAKAIGSAIGSGSGFAGAFKAVFSEIGNFVSQLGDYLVKYGIEMEIAKKAIATLNPVVAIGAGIVLEILGATMQSAMTPRKFSQGGIVGGVGNSDTVPALLTPGEMVIPKDKVPEAIAAMNAYQISMKESLSGIAKNLVQSPFATTLKDMGSAFRDMIRIQVPNISSPSINFNPSALDQMGLGGKIQLHTGEFRLRGNDLVAQYAITNQRWNRNGFK